MKAFAYALLTIAGIANIVRADNATPVAMLDVDACRLDNGLPSAVSTALTTAWRVAAARYPRAPKGVTINPLGMTPELAIFFVKDQLAGGERCATATPGDGDGSARDFDSETVIGFCQARPPARTIICSSNAVRALLDRERAYAKQFAADRKNVHAVEVDNSPSLIYLFAHEFGHILLEHPGAFFDGVEPIHLGPDRTRNIEAFSRACKADNDQIQREKAADAFAFEVARELFSQQPFRNETTMIGAVSVNSELIYWTSKAFAGWSGVYYGDFQGSPVPNIPQMCQMVGEKSGSIVSPVFGGSHPLLWSRLAAEVSQASEYIATTQSEEPAGRDKDRDKEVADAWERNQMMDSIMAQAMEQAAAQYCKNISALKNGLLDCTNPPKLKLSDTQVFVEGEADATPGTYQAWFSYAQGSRERKQWAAARRGYEQALPLARKASDQVYIANILNDLGALDVTESNAEDAEKAFKESVAIRRRLAHQDAGKHSQELAGGLFNLGYLYAEEHRTTDARRCLSESLGIFRSIQKRRPADSQPQIQQILDILDTLPK